MNRSIQFVSDLEKMKMYQKYFFTVILIIIYCGVVSPVNTKTNMEIRPPEGVRNCCKDGSQYDSQTKSCIGPDLALYGFFSVECSKLQPANMTHLKIVNVEISDVEK